MSGNQAKWILKNQRGQIAGPFTTEQILKQIDRGAYFGNELIAPYPGGKWTSISKAPQFSDRLLDTLAAEARPVNGSNSKGRPPAREDTEEGDENESPPERDVTRPQMPNSPRQPADESAEQGFESVGAPSFESDPSGFGNERSNVVPLTRSQMAAPSSVIELTDLKALERKERIKSSKLPLVFVSLGLLLALGALFWPGTKSRNTGDRIHLLAPGKAQAPLGEARIKEKFKKALLSIQTDTFSGYLRAQNELVEIIEGGPVGPEHFKKKAEWVSTLCMVYRELWPFAFQDSRDTRVVSYVMQEAKRLDPGGRNGAICEVVHHVLNGREREAQGLAESMLGEESQAPVLFEIRGEIYSLARDHTNAVTYFGQARSLWPGWQKASIQEARARAALGQYPSAIQLYRNVLTAVPSHAVARIEWGMLEVSRFNQYDKAVELLEAGLEGKERVANPIASAGWFGLATVYEKRNQKSKAVDSARRAYTLNSANLEAKQMIIRLAGAAELDNTKVGGRELMYLGDQYVRSGDCYAAQAQFKAAFEADPKNGVAAMKAARCLWQLNQSMDAIEWLKQAVKADPQLTGAYVQLADYYAQRFDYMAAAQVLRKIQQLQPQSYEVYRGLAALELRRNSYQGAINFATRAMKLYETDLETFLIMAKANLGMQNFADAQKYAAKAIELDFSNTEAHSLYGKTVAGLQGIDAGASYIQQMINRQVITQGQSVPQAAIDLRVTLSEIYMQDERVQPAEDILRQAISLDPNHKKALVSLGKVLQAHNQQPKALELFLRAAVLDPSDADPMFLAGQLYLDVNKPGDAARQFDRVLKINPKYPRTHVMLGRVYMRLGDVKKALDEANQEKAINPDLPDGYLLAAESYFEMKQYSNCAGEYQQATRRVRSALMLVKMARCYRLANALDSAQSLLKQAQSLENGLPDLYKEQGAIYHMKGMADEAIAAYDTYLKLVPTAADKSEIEDRIRKAQAGDTQLDN